jgi:leucyl/phenylalanyl-tRNA--protein transferase
MSIFLLNEELIFPPVNLADPSGVLAIGGDLSTERLLLAYRSGIFPWFNDNEPILWWSPDPRFILFPDKLHVSKSMQKVLKKQLFDIKYDTAFKEVISSCRKTRIDNNEGSWITQSMIDAYCNLNKLGYAHSVEAWHEGNLVGGLYGVSLGRCFFGESMFSIMENSSKACLITLVNDLIKYDFLFIDCQVYTKHLSSMGAIDIPRSDFLKLLSCGLNHSTITGNWSLMLKSDK